MAIVGIHSPPYGGVSIHIQRLLPYLDDANIDYVLFNTGPTPIQHPRVMNVGRSISWLLPLLFKPLHTSIHFHTSLWWVRTLGALLAAIHGCRIIVTAHGASLLKSISSKNLLVRTLSRWSVKKFHCIIATNEYIREALLEHGVDRDRIRDIPAFLPPGEASDDMIPSEVRNFCETHHPRLMATARPVMLGGNDAYGLEMMTNLIDHLREEFPNIGLVIFLPQNAGEKTERLHFEPLFERVRGSLLSNHILFHESTGEFYPALRHCDLFLRPTTTDGDANSIREALIAGVPVVASDVIPRPTGSTTYRGGDQEDLRKITAEVLRSLETHIAEVKAHPPANHAKELIALYSEIL